MKRLILRTSLLILVASIVTGMFFGFKTGETYELTITKGHYIERDGVMVLVVPVILTNTSKNHWLNYLSWTCSKTIFYRVDNPKLKFLAEPCTRNLLYEETLPPLKSDTVELNVTCQPGNEHGAFKFRIGMNLLFDDGPTKIYDRYENGEHIPPNMIWSNAVIWDDK